jgi:hypothetical protein
MCSGDFERLLQCHYSKLYGAPLVPLHMWFDRPHIARVSAYRHMFCCYRIRNFIEDSLGVLQVTDLSARGMSGHVRYGTFLWYDDADARCVTHVHARRRIGEAERAVFLARSTSSK